MPDDASVQPKPWSAVADSDAFKALPPDKQEAARAQYFDQVVAPHVPEPARATARTQFDRDTGPDAGVKRAKTDIAAAIAAGGGDKLGWERSFLYGATLGWEPEIMADLTYATEEAAQPIERALGHEPKYTPGEYRKAVRESEREQQAAFIENHPIMGRATEFAGGFMTPGVGKVGEWVDAAGSTLGKIGRGAVAGAGYGAAAGAADERDRVGGAAVGAGFGAAGGAASTGIGAAIRAGLPSVARFMGSSMSDAWSRIKAGFGGGGTAKLSPAQQADIEQKALAYVSQLAESAGRTPESIGESQIAASGKPEIGAEALGRTGVSQMTALGRRQGTTPDALESALRTRQQGTPDRILNDLEAVTGIDPAAVQGDFQTLAAQLRRQARPLYEAAYNNSDGTTKTMTSLVLDELAQRPSMKAALGRAFRIAAEEGVDPTVVGLVPKVETINLPGGPMQVLKEVEVKNPTVKTWDYIKRGLGDEIYDKHRNPMTGKLDLKNLNDEGRATKRTLDALRDEMFKLSPAYRLAVQAGGEPIRLEEIYAAVPKLLRPETSESVLADRVKDASPAEMEALKGGTLFYIHDAARSGRLRLRDLQQPAFQEKLKTILGDQPAADFLGMVESEISLAKTGARMAPGVGSVTSEATMADAERDKAFQTMATASGMLMKGKPIAAAAHLVSNVIARGAAPIDQATRDEVGRLLLLPPDQLGGVLQAYQSAGGPRGQAAGIVQRVLASPGLADAARRAALIASAGPGEAEASGGTQPAPPSLPPPPPGPITGALGAGP